MSEQVSRSGLRKHAPALIAVALAMLAILVFWSPLRSWFSSGDDVGTKSKALQSELGEVSLAVAAQPATPEQGKNTLVISLTRGDQAIASAAVKVEVWMPAMGAMPEMRSKAEVTESKAGEYRALFELSMAGSWTATVETQVGEEKISAEYSLTVGTPGLRMVGNAQRTSAIASTSSTASKEAQLPAYTFGSSATSSILAALDAYEAVREQLAKDSLDGVASGAGALERAMDLATAAETGAPQAVREQLESASASARALAKSTSLDDARHQFSDISEVLVALGGVDASLMGERYVFECPMWEGFSMWIQPGEELENPYMGPEMLTCGSEQGWGAPRQAEPHTHDPSEIAHYTCPMHPWVKEADPSEPCPVCGMKLTPVTKEEITEGIIRIDRERRQAFGVRTAMAERKALTVPIHALGRVTYDETKLVDVTLKFQAWIERLFVEETGQYVKKGQALFEVYGPELFAAQHELILAAQQEKTATSDLQRSRAETLLRSARKRFLLWDFRPAQIEAIIRRGEPMERLTIYAKASGYLIEKNIVEGAAVEIGMRLFRIADLSRVWIEAEVYEQDIPLVRIGQKARVILSNIDSNDRTGTVSFIWPAIDPKTRAARIRIELENADLSLRPEMFAEVRLESERGVALVVPEPAILYSGPRRIVFVDLGDDRLRPTLVEAGVTSGGMVEILKGLEVGDKVVVSGNFLVAAESRLKSSTGIW